MATASVPGPVSAVPAAQQADQAQAVPVAAQVAAEGRYNFIDLSRVCYKLPFSKCPAGGKVLFLFEKLIDPVGQISLQL